MPWVLGQRVGNLTLRQQRVDLLAATGSSDDEMASTLGITSRMVPTPLTQAYGKIDMASRRKHLCTAQLTVEAVET